MRFTTSSSPIRVRKMLASLRRSLPGTLYIFVAFAILFDLCRLLAQPLLSLEASFTEVWKDLPPWTSTLFGLFLVVVVLGVAAVPLYLLFESLLILSPPFGRSAVGLSLSRLAREDLMLSIDAIEQDTRVTRPYAVLLALWARIWDLRALLRRLRNLQEIQSRDLFLRTLDNVRVGWRDGLQGSILLDHLVILDQLPLQADTDRLQGQVIAANITYLLGDLHQGLHLADKNMSEAERYDVGRLPVYQWLSSYAHANARLFLGDFEHAATLLGERWRLRYLALSEPERCELLERLKSLSTLNPIASVGRHILLASAFAGKPLIKADTNPDSARAPESSKAWAQRWFQLSLELGKEDRITEDFTRAYMALYCILVEKVDDPDSLLEQISDAAPPVSQYAKYGVRGLVFMTKGRHCEALADLRRADTQSRMSGNRFFDGIFLAAHASVAVLCDPTHLPEARKLLRRAQARAALARSAFYDSQIDAARAVLAVLGNRPGEAKRLMTRAFRVEHGLLQLYRQVAEEHDIKVPSRPDAAKPGR